VPRSHSSFPRSRCRGVPTGLLLAHSPSPSLINPRPPSPPAARHRVRCRAPGRSQRPVPTPPRPPQQSPAPAWSPRLPCRIPSPAGPRSSNSARDGERTRGTSPQPLSPNVSVLLVSEAASQLCWPHALRVPSPRLPWQHRVPWGFGPCFSGVLDVCWCHFSRSLRGRARRRGCRVSCCGRSRRTPTTMPGGVSGLVWHVCLHTSAPQCRRGLRGAHCSRGCQPRGCAGGLQARCSARVLGSSTKPLPRPRWGRRLLLSAGEVPSSQGTGFAIPSSSQFFAVHLSSIQGSGESEQRAGLLLSATSRAVDLCRENCSLLLWVSRHQGALHSPNPELW